MHVLQATKRAESGRKTYGLRQDGKVPAVVYGVLDQPESVTVDRNEFVRLFREAGESTVIELQLDGKPVNVLIQDYQLDPLRDEVIHADFRAIDMNKALEADVKLVFIGESAAVKGLGGTLVHPVSSLTVRALPANLPSKITVDLSRLATFDDVIRVSDLDLGEGVEAMAKPERTIAVVTPPRTEAEMAALDEAVSEDVAGVEVEGEKKEGEEGAAAAEAPAEENKEEKKEE